MIIRDEKYSNVVYLPSTTGDVRHSPELIIDDYDQWSNLGVREAQMAYCCFRPDPVRDEAA